MSSELGPLQAEAVSRLQLQLSRKLKQINQINSVNWNFYFDIYLNLHIYIYNFFLLPQTIILFRHQTLASIAYSIDVCRRPWRKYSTRSHGTVDSISSLSVVHKTRFKC
ncbi:hypothetical protein BCR33DRAFT_26240 [Rhizoclosmatium globosum]|uniref:Uncharacterized protein n=1 Tax=Rhizoclosmatium globosum TaxID=329046 RepID=A0A1Y2AXG5_9FUNG|nr:hypothetical protein BCR33DRAFT_26240 [Rhizoclosmatium globosum]|eukprot:ORY27279.1 hypothetical protein BCR33DRAFT_26240 [Rhizoclosmatium globosum]